MMKMRAKNALVFIFIFIEFVVLFSCDCQRHGSGDAGVVCSECRQSSSNKSVCVDQSQICDLEYELYSKFLKELTGKPIAVVIDRTSLDYCFLQYSNFPEASCETYDAYADLCAAKKTYALEGKFTTELTITLMSGEDFSTLVWDKGWEFVRDNYGCVYGFTRIGFNKARDEAIFGRMIGCDTGWGRVETVLYRKVDGVWKEIRVITHGTS